MFVDEKKHGEVIVDEIGHILLKAADLIEKHGHAKHIEHARTGEMCWAGALRAAWCGGKYPSWKDIRGFAEGGKQISDCAVRMGYSSVTEAVHWNNAPETTGQMVIDAMRRAAYQPA